MRQAQSSHDYRDGELLVNAEFNLVGWLHHVHRQQGRCRRSRGGVTKEKLTVAAVLSGNRLFEGRINPLVKANYLASPPLVVAYAIAGRVDIDLASEPLGKDSAGKDVFLRDLWPSNEEIQAAVKKSVRREMFAKQYSEVFKGDAQWNSIKVPPGDQYAWNDSSTYIKCPPYFDRMADPATSVKD